MNEKAFYLFFGSTEEISEWLLSAVTKSWIVHKEWPGGKEGINPLQTRFGSPFLLYRVARKTYLFSSSSHTTWKDRKQIKWQRKVIVKCQFWDFFLFFNILYFMLFNSIIYIYIFGSSKKWITEFLQCTSGKCSVLLLFTRPSFLKDLGYRKKIFYTF